MARFTIGEEVLLDGERFVVSRLDPAPSTRVRLLATTPDGARFAWSTVERLTKIASYTKPRDDTRQLPRRT
jgi:hypothetical protein